VAVALATDVKAEVPALDDSKKGVLGAVLGGTLLILWLAGCGSGGGSGGPGTAASDAKGPDVLCSVTPTAGSAPLVIHFDASASADPDGGLLAFAWVFGNGETSSAPSGTVTYASAGTYTVLLTVTNAAGLSAADQVTVRVLAPAGAESAAERVVYLTNLERRANGLAPLKGQSNLAAAALAHAEDMAALDYFAHQSADGRSPWDRLEASGYDYSAAGENIAAGYPTPEAVMEGWMASPGHRANILDASFRELGVGHVREEGDTFPGPYGYGDYWVQDFGARSAVFPVVIEDEAFEISNPEVALYVYGSGWATEMAISEAPDFAGAAWGQFAAEVTWGLSPEPGLKTVCVRLRRGAEERTACDEIWLR
jgi:uncharacterized protein YkwD